MIYRSNITCITILQKDISMCTQKKSKEVAFDNVVFELSLLFAKRSDPHSVSKIPKIRKVFFLSSCLKDLRGILSIHSHGIQDP